MFTDNSKSLTKENILKVLDSYQLFRVYCPNFEKIGVKFKVDGRKDNDPSGIISPFNGDLMYRDFRERNGLRVFDYIGKRFDLDYYQVLQKINSDFNLQLGYSENSTGISLAIPEKSGIDYKSIIKVDTKIDIKRRDWTNADKAYWDSYHIPLRLLEYHNIKSIEYYWITNNKKDNACYAVSPNVLAYSYDYYWNKGIFRRKLYFPKNKSGRFVSNVDSTIVQGWTLLPKAGGEMLFVTKGYKDILIFNLLGYWAIAPNNEHAYIPEHVMIKLKTRWKNLFVWFDNDEGGIKGAQSFSEKFDLKWTHNPVGEPKDPSDYVKKYGLNQFDKLTSNFLQHAST